MQTLARADIAHIQSHGVCRYQHTNTQVDRSKKCTDRVHLKRLHSAFKYTWCMRSPSLCVGVLGLCTVEL